MQLNLKPAQLRLIVEVAESGQLQMAAAATSMTQPAASRMLAEIERAVGAPLFLRQPKGMELTEIGAVMVRRARAMLREMRSMAAEVQALREGQGGAVRVGAVTGPAVGYLVPAIRAIKREAPDAEITVDVLPSRDLLRQLTAGEMDFALARVLPDFDSREFEIHPMRDEKVALLVRAGHPLARAPRVTFTELTDYEWIMQERGAPIREATLEAFGAVGLAEPGNIVNSPSLLLMIAYLSRSDAIAGMSEEVAQLLTQPPVSAGFAVLTMPREVRVSPYYMLNLRRRPLSPVAARLRELVIAHSEAGGTP
ncbi:LysR family transcriptional regulator [Gemmobacter aquaticus]|jgi:DNA-binding transcriptional LysR family regulator|uniref:LysR family transcriptional regulator n=1 Tax=Gemmobacter aquaticus TaxID=490185 RepID=A0A917YL28_9RHOB|nr:LysR family transcriptional regulator [Gemmobacter aquaticus]GGO34229.1 LysR family transcriptional regulator [Gemmobacter aquaticus]